MREKPSCAPGWARHAWQRFGGVAENPGVWSVGGTRFRFDSRCLRCGAIRREHHMGPQERARGERNYVTYEPAVVEVRP